VGDVGRPDLLGGTLSKEALAGMMYDSLRKHILPLADDVLVYPAHGPGSACGKNIGKETWSTIGEQKRSNYALKNIPREEFISLLTSGLAAPPPYFFSDAAINKEGYLPIQTVIQNNLKPLSVAAFQKAVIEGAQILDTREPGVFEKGFIAGSVNIGLQGTFAVWAGTLLDIGTPLVLLCEEGKEAECILRLARVGYERVSGYLQGGLSAWVAEGLPLDTIHSVTPETFCSLIQSSDEVIIDVRKEGEYETCHVQGARLIPLTQLEANIGTFDPGKKYLIHCAGGYRSMIASSLLKRHGITNFQNVLGGMAKIKEAGAPVEESIS